MSELEDELVHRETKKLYVSGIGDAKPRKRREKGYPDVFGPEEIYPPQAKSLDYVAASALSEGGSSANELASKMLDRDKGLYKNPKRLK